jgi:hypothetical protein
MKSSTSSSWFRLLGPALALLLGLLLTTTVVSAMTLSARPTDPVDVPGGIEGTLYAPDGTTGIANGWIEIFDAEMEPWMGTETAPDGHFEITNLPAGEYILHAYPPEGSPYAASVPEPVEVFSGQFTSATLRLTQVRISGYVRDCDAIPEKRIEGATVAAHSDDSRVWDRTNINGEFKLGGVMNGVPYILETSPPPESEYVPLEPIVVTPTVGGVVLEMCIPPTNVLGTVRDPASAPVPGAWAVVWNEFFWDETTADEAGEFLFRGLPVGPSGTEFTIHAGPPWGEGLGLIAAEPFTFFLDFPTSTVHVPITLPYAYKTLTGRVVFAGTSDSVGDAEVHARRLDGPGFAGGPVDATGAFTLTLTGGEWHVGLEPTTWPANWIFTGPPAWVVFDQNTTPETKTVTLEVVPTNASVIGQVACPGGCPGDMFPEDVWVELRNEDINNGTHIDGSYGFEIPIPDGWYELVIHVGHPALMGPEPIPLSVGPEQTLTLLDPIELRWRDAHIAGRVRSESGQPVEGIPLFAWRAEGWGSGWAETDASGAYTMPVTGGEWFIEPQPRPDRPYVFRGPPSLVRVAPGGTMVADFELTQVNARIEGTAVDAATSERLWELEGGAWAELYPSGEFFSDAPMREGAFSLKAKGGFDYVVGVQVPPQAPYVPDMVGPVAVQGAIATATVPLEQKDAVIEGQLIDALTGAPPTEPMWAEVFGEDAEGHWVSVVVDPDTGGYAAGVVSGTWHLRSRVDPDSGYVAPPTPVAVSVASGAAVAQNFELWPITAVISGQVLKPDGTTPMSKTFAFAEGESPFVGYFETHSETDDDGRFELLVPEGGYVVGAALPGDELAARDWLNPRPVDVPWVAAGSPAAGLELRFRQHDGLITGTVSFAPGISVAPTHPAYVWGWADSGEWAETEAITSGAATFVYEMPVVSGTVWHVGAVYEDPGNGLYYESSEESVNLTGVGQATQDLVLDGPHPLPQPIIVTFDGTQMQTIVIPDGVELSIPPRALVVSGTVTLFIFPTQELRPEKGREVIGTGYEMWAVNQSGQEITQFDRNVMMTFPYPPDSDLDQQGISEHLLVPVYYSTLAGRWILADSYTVDTVNNEITLQIDHFSKFGTMAVSEREHNIYLPLIFRSYGS